VFAKMKTLLSCATNLTRAAVPATAMLAGLASAASAAPLVTATVDDAVTTAVTGERSSYLAMAKDLGAVDDSVALTHAVVVLKRPPALQAALDKLVSDQQDRKSSSYHKWVAASDLRAYGPDAADVAKVVTWLQSHGITVNGVAKSGMSIDISAPASRLGQAFHTTLHTVQLPNGEIHIANMTDLAIPAALAPVLRGATLSNFFPKPNFTKRSPQYTFHDEGVTFYAVTPPDFATIYNLTPLLTGNNLFGAVITGAGVKIAVVEQTLILHKDWEKFRKTFGLSSYASKLSFEQPGACENPGYSPGDETEAAIDAEYASGAAPGADIIEAACAGGTLGFGVETSLQGLVESGTNASVLSISYGGAEQGDGLTFLAGWENLVEEGAAEGLSIFVSSGDSAAAAGEEDLTDGLGVNGLSTTPYNTAVGGTDFQDTALKQNKLYWTKKNSATGDSALSYIPEIPWDNSCSSSVIASYLHFSDAIASCNSTKTIKGPPYEQPNIGGTGGQSLIYAKPSWQNAPGVPNDGVRDQPDVSLFASNGSWNHFYLICMSDVPNGGAPCDYHNKTDILDQAYGGTSISAPGFAGIFALAVEILGKQGNAAPQLYQLAAAQFNSPVLSQQCRSALGNGINTKACVFNDLTVGDNAAVCESGTVDCYANSESVNGFGVMRSASYSDSIDAFPTTAGYDLASGLGSVNITNLIINLYEDQP
jgi:subtilase family serine protease